MYFFLYMILCCLGVECNETPRTATYIKRVYCDLASVTSDRAVLSVVVRRRVEVELALNCLDNLVLIDRMLCISAFCRIFITVIVIKCLIFNVFLFFTLKFCVMVPKIVFISVSTFDPKKHAPGEINKEPSCTVPDMCLTIHELLDRYGRGLSVTEYAPVFEDQVGIELPDIRTLDLTELEDLKSDVVSRIKTIRKDLKKAAKPVVDNPLKQQEIEFGGKEAEPGKNEE